VIRSSSPPAVALMLTYTIVLSGYCWPQPRDIRDPPINLQSLGMVLEKSDEKNSEYKYNSPVRG
jgi:hypothetical protein